MSDSLEELLAHHRGGSILIDANLLVLLFVGGFDRELIGKHKRTATYTPEDYDLLLQLVAVVPNLVTTPHILAEVNSLSGQMGEPKRTAYLGHFAGQIRVLEEQYLPSAGVVENDHFAKLGLTDSIIMALALEFKNVPASPATERAGVLVLTDDFRLSNVLAAAELDVINFNHVRTFNWS